MPKFKVSIIGLGRICCHYLKILNSKEFNNVNITSVCDIKKNKLVKFTRKYKHPLTFTNLNDLFKFVQPRAIDDGLKMAKIYWPGALTIITFPCL